MKKGMKNIQVFMDRMMKKNISAFSASTAFFLFISLIPMLAILCAVIPYTPITEETLLTVMKGYVSESVSPLVEGVIEDVYAQSAGILSIAIIGTLWTAGKGMMALLQGLNVVYEAEENRNYFVLRMVASFYTLVMIIAVILSLVLLVFGNLLAGLVLKDFPQTQLLFQFVMNFRFVFSWVILTLVFTLLYTYVPSGKLRFREQLTGGMFSAVVWSIFSWCFSVYVETFGGFGTYGSLATIVMVMLYLYFCMYIILVGAYLNHYLTKRTIFTTINN